MCMCGMSHVTPLPWLRCPVVAAASLLQVFDAIARDVIARLQQEQASQQQMAQPQPMKLTAADTSQQHKKKDGCCG